MARLVAFWPVALAGGVALMVAGCTADPSPIATETPTAVASASPTPTPTASPSPTALTPDDVLAAIPENARGENFQSASEFAKFFVKQYDVMFQTQDTRLFEALSTPECQFCASSLNSYAELVVAGGRREGGEISPAEGMLQGGLNDDGYWYVIMPYSVTETRDFDSEGVEVDLAASASGTAYLKLGRIDDRWAVFGVEIE